MRLRGPLAAGAVMLAFSAAPAVAGSGKVATGNYESSPVIKGSGTYSVGIFSVAKSGKRRSIVPTEGYNGIYYPDARECDSFDLPLAATSIPISSKRRFKISERTPVEDSVVQVNWKGHWSKPGNVSGSITIKHDGCTSTHKWTGGKVG